MFQRIVQKVRESTIAEMIARFRGIYEVADQRSRQIIIASQINKTVSVLFGTFAVGGVAAFLIVLSKPKIVLDNRYISMAYQGLGFENQSYFLLFLSGVLLLFIIVQQLVAVLSQIIEIRLQEGLARRYTVMLCRYYMTENYESYVRRGTSEVISKSLMEVPKLAWGEVIRLSNTVSAVINIILIVGFLAVVNAWIMALLFSAVAIANYAFYVAYEKKAGRLGKKLHQQQMRRVRLVKEGTAAAVEIKLMGKEREFVNRIDQTLIEMAHNRMQLARMQFIPQRSIPIMCTIVLYVVAVYVFLTNSHEGIFTLLALSAASVFRLMPLVSGLMNISLRQKENKFKYERIIEDLRAAKNQAEEYLRSDKPFKRVQVRDAVAFDHVTYTYPAASEPVIRNLSFSIPANKVVALFGKSGIGKTTIIRLLSGLLTPQEGRILVDGRSLQEDVGFKRNWQQSSGVAFQKPFFMAASLATNIAFESEKSKIDYDRVRECAKLAQLEDLVSSLPNGLDTEVYEEAEVFSGGQRQRISIARALYRNSSVLVLDEATNSLDLVVERQILSALVGMVANQLIVVVAHRPETLRFADLITIIKSSDTVVQGTYDELLEEDEDFRAILGKGAAGGEQLAG